MIKKQYRELQIRACLSPDVYKKNRKEIKRLSKCESLTINDLFNVGVIWRMEE
jgi:hypothetical protein